MICIYSYMYCILVDTTWRQNWLHNFARFLVEPWLLPGCALWGHWWPRIALPWSNGGANGGVCTKRFQVKKNLQIISGKKISHLVHPWYVQLQGFKLRMWRLWRMWKSTATFCEALELLQFAEPKLTTASLPHGCRCSYTSHLTCCTIL